LTGINAPAATPPALLTRLNREQCTTISFSNKGSWIFD
jgi:hypothetical protein